MAVLDTRDNHPSTLRNRKPHAVSISAEVSVNTRPSGFQAGLHVTGPSKHATLCVGDLGEATHSKIESSLL